MIKTLKKIKYYLLCAGITITCLGLVHYWQVKQVEKWLQPDLILYNQGCIAYEKGDFRKAAQLFQKTINNSNSDKIKEMAWYNLGNVYVQLELPKRARDCYIEALKIDPIDWEAKYNLERLYVFYPLAFPNEDEKASLDSADAHEAGDKDRMGRSSPPKPDI